MKLMDKLEGGSMRNLFRTQPEPTPITSGETPEPGKVVEIQHREKKAGETYNQYGFRVAGLSEGSADTLDPCLQAVYFGIRKEQESDANLQDELQKKLNNKKAELETDRKKLLNEIEVSENKQKELEKDIDEKKDELSSLKGGTKDRNKSAWISLIISAVLLVPFSIYFFIFYSSVSYSAFFWSISATDTKGLLTAAILNPNAISNAWNEGFAPFILILCMPIIFLAFGYVLHYWERQTTKTKYFKIPALILAAFVFDTLLAYAICKKIYDIQALAVLTAMPPYSMGIAFQDPSFWLVIFMGFVSYLIWGFVFGIFITSWENLDLNPEKRKQLEERIEDLKTKLENERKHCLDLRQQEAGIDPKIKEVDSQMGVSARYDLAKIKLELNNFFAGWQTYMAASQRSDEEKQLANQKFENLISQIKVVE